MLALDNIVGTCLWRYMVGNEPFCGYHDGSPREIAERCRPSRPSCALSQEQAKRGDAVAEIEASYPPGTPMGDLLLEQARAESEDWRRSLPTDVLARYAELCREQAASRKGPLYHYLSEEAAPPACCLCGKDAGLGKYMGAPLCRRCYDEGDGASLEPFVTAWKSKGGEDGPAGA
ncbi:MAG: hypothetical protein JRN42_08215 [Nitrososphaerota archaeon]|nr:hypothetical protein [Nitrososphaerota archaeon]